MNVINKLIVVKRSGQRVPFNPSKIALAIKKGFDSVSNNYNPLEINSLYNKAVKYIEDKYHGRKTITVEDIQNIIEEELKQNNYLDVYQSFKEYREKRAKSREVFALKQEHKLVKAVDEIANLVATKEIMNIPVKEIINDFGHKIASEISKAYILENKYIKAHDEGDIYIHDLSYLATGMLPSIHLQIDDKMINEGIFKSLSNFKKEVSKEIYIDGIDQSLNSFMLKEYQKILFRNIENTLKILGIYEYIKVNELENLINNIQDINIDSNYFEPIILNEKLTMTINQVIDISQKELKAAIDNLLKELVLFMDDDYIYHISFNSSGNNISKMISLSLIDYLNLHESNKITLSCLINQETNEKHLEDIVSRIEKHLKITFNSNNSSEITIAMTSINLPRIAIKSLNKPKKYFYNELDKILKLTKGELVSAFESISNHNIDSFHYLFVKEEGSGNQKIRKMIKNGYLKINLTGLLVCAKIIDQDKYLTICEEIIDYIGNKVRTFIQEEKLNFAVSVINDKTVCESFLRLDQIVYNVKAPDYFICEAFEYLESDLDHLKTLGKINNKIPEIKDLGINIKALKKEWPKIIMKASSYGINQISIRSDKT